MPRAPNRSGRKAQHIQGSKPPSGQPAGTQHSQVVKIEPTESIKTEEEEEELPTNNGYTTTTTTTTASTIAESTMHEMPKPKAKGTIFDVKEKSKLFEVVDKFRELGISEDISLPQVCDNYLSSPLILNPLSQIKPIIIKLHFLLLTTSLFVIHIARRSRRSKFRKVILIGSTYWSTFPSSGYDLYEICYADCVS